MYTTLDNNTINIMNTFQKHFPVHNCIRRMCVCTFLSCRFLHRQRIILFIMERVFVCWYSTCIWPMSMCTTLFYMRFICINPLNVVECHCCCCCYFCWKQWESYRARIYRQKISPRTSLQIAFEFTLFTLVYFHWTLFSSLIILFSCWIHITQPEQYVSIPVMLISLSRIMYTARCIIIFSTQQFSTLN